MLSEEEKEQYKSELKEYVDKWLSQMKDSLLLQLLGFLQDSKNTLEHQLGSFEEKDEVLENKVLENKG